MSSKELQDLKTQDRVPAYREDGKSNEMAHTGGMGWQSEIK